MRHRTTVRRADLIEDTGEEEVERLSRKAETRKAESGTEVEGLRSR
jgi:hypothetical protein